MNNPGKYKVKWKSYYYWKFGFRENLDPGACQRNHWKVHKHECGKQSLNAGAAAPGADDDDGAGMEDPC